MGYVLGAENIVYGHPTCKTMCHEYFHYLVLDHVQGTKRRQKCTKQNFFPLNWYADVLMLSQ